MVFGPERSSHHPILRALVMGRSVKWMVILDVFVEKIQYGRPPHIIRFKACRVSCHFPSVL